MNAGLCGRDLKHESNQWLNNGFQYLRRGPSSSLHYTHASIIIYKVTVKVEILARRKFHKLFILKNLTRMARSFLL